MLEVKGLRVLYSENAGLFGADIRVPDGEVFAVLGPNGSGKTTLLKTMCDVLRPDAGDVYLDGRPLRERKRDLGYMPEEPCLLPTLTVWQNLVFVAGLKKRGGADEISGLLETFRLAPKARALAGNLSQGQRRKVQLAAALLGDPRVLVLDEPTNGLDTAALLALRDVLAGRRERGKTTILTSHVLEYVEGVATGHVFLKNGVTVEARGRGGAGGAGSPSGLSYPGGSSGPGGTPTLEEEYRALFP
jgi:ABC-type multidrug transport system ATPase subunit